MGPARNDGTTSFLADAALVAVTLLLFVQIAGQWDLGIWISDQGRDALWAESVASAQRFPRLGPAASGVQLQGPVYYLWMGLLRWLSLPGWRVGMLLLAALAAQAALIAKAATKLSSRRTVALALGLALGHVGLATFLLTATNPSWVPLVCAAVLALVAGAGSVTTATACALRFLAAGALWILAVELHLSAVVAAPALCVATFMPERRLRAAAWAGLGAGAGLSLVALSGGWGVAVDMVSGLVAQQAGAPVAAPLAERLASWLVLPWRLAAWWAGHGVLGRLGLFAAVAHWAVLLVGIGLAAVSLRGATGSRRVWLLVVLVWAGGGLLYPIVVRTTAFYYLVGALPALYLAAGHGLVQRRWSTWLGVATLAVANLSVLQVGRSLQRDGEWRLPSFTVWWASSEMHVPTLRATRGAIAALAERGLSFDCALQSVHGGPWVAAMMDGGVLASRLLPPALGQPCPSQGLALRRAADGRVALTPFSAAADDGWLPAPVVPRQPTEVARPALRPFAGVLTLPADGQWRTVTVLTIDAPPELCCGRSWEALGLGRFRARLDGRAVYRVVGQGRPAWVDVAPDE